MTPDEARQLVDHAEALDRLGRELLERARAIDHAVMLARETQFFSFGGGSALGLGERIRPRQLTDWQLRELRSGRGVDTAGAAT